MAHCTVSGSWFLQGWVVFYLTLIIFAVCCSDDEDGRWSQIDNMKKKNIYKILGGSPAQPLGASWYIVCVFCFMIGLSLYIFID